MKSTAKAICWMRSLKDLIGFRLPSSTIREQFDANGWPMIFVSATGNEAAGQNVIALRIKAIDAVSKDIFGGSLIAFGPHELELAYELDVNGKPIPAIASFLNVNKEAEKLGIKLLVEEIANASAVNEANMNAAYASAIAIENDVQWPLKGM